jgi:hypothetical protein
MAHDWVMRLSTRPGDHPPTQVRIVVWSDDSATGEQSCTDLGVLLAAALSWTIFAITLLVALNTGGAVRVGAAIAAGIAGLYGRGFTLPLVLVLLGAHRLGKKLRDD